MTAPLKRTPRKEDAPCYECPDRYTACSDKCQKPEYLAWKERKQTIAQNRIKLYTVDAYVTDQIRKNRRGK